MMENHISKISRWVLCRACGSETRDRIRADTVLKNELRGGDFKDYKDKGYSGKNTDRPKFQELLADIRQGLIRRVVV